MLSLDSARRYYFCEVPITFRYRHKGMRGFIRTQLHMDPSSGDVFIFLSKDGHRMRLYYYHRCGEIMTDKIMHDARFVKPVFDQAKKTYQISWDSFVYLLEGLIPRGREEQFSEVESELCVMKSRGMKKDEKKFA